LAELVGPAPASPTDARWGVSLLLFGGPSGATGHYARPFTLDVHLGDRIVAPGMTRAFPASPGVSGCRGFWCGRWCGHFLGADLIPSSAAALPFARPRSWRPAPSVSRDQQDGLKALPPACDARSSHDLRTEGRQQRPLACASHACGTYFIGGPTSVASSSASSSFAPTD
jgi:hypothetical protein